MKNRGVSAQLNSSNSSVTQPVGEGRSHRRVKQIEVLHQEFQDLKKKIKDVESRNEQIIQNIHKRYDFKKKQQPRTTQYMESKSPIVHYDGQEKSHISADNQSNNSNESECQFKIAKHPSKKTSNIKKNVVPNHHQSVQYRKTEHVSDQLQPSQVASSKGNLNLPRKPQTPPQSFGYGTASHFRQMPPIAQDPFQLSQYSGLPQYQMSMQFPPYPSMAESFYGTNNNFQFEEAIRRQKQKVRILQKQLEEKQADTIALKRLQKKVNSLSLTFGEVVDGALEEFYQEVMKKGFYQIQKHIRKNQNKLKKLHLMVKDKQEETRSIKNISQHRLKRSISRSKRDNSPTNNSYNSVPRGPNRKNLTGQQNSSQNLAVQNSSASKSKQQSDISKSSVKFEQIAGQYEQMIKQKNKALEIFELRYKQKQKELVQLSSKYQKLQLKIRQIEQLSPRKKSLKQCSERQQNLLSSFQSEIEKEGQIKLLSRKISQIQENSKKKQNQMKQKDSNLQKLSKKLNQLQFKTKKLQNQLNLQKQDKRKYEEDKLKDAEIHIRFKRLQAQMLSKQHQYSLIMEKSVKIQNQKIQSDCENVNLINRLKKIETLLVVKEQKIQQLQKIIQSNNGFELPDLLEKSMTIQKLDQNQIQILQQERQKLQESLNKKNEQVFKMNKNIQIIQSKLIQEVKRNEELKREIQNLLIQNESMRLNMKALQFEKYSVKSARLDNCSPLQKLLEQNQCLSEHQDNNIREQLQYMRNKHEDAQRIIKAQKHQSLDFNTKIIKINSELSYYRESLTERQNKYEKLKKQFEQGRCQINQLTQALQRKQAELQQQKRNHNQKLLEIQAQMFELQQEKFGNRSQILDSHNLSELRNSRNFSEESFVGYRNTFNNINAQNQLLTQKLKEAEKMIEIQKQMQEKIMDEYRGNVDKIKADLREKSKQNENLLQQMDILLRKLKHLEQFEQKIKQIPKTQDQEQLLGMSNERIIQLQIEINQLKQINAKMADVEEELLNQLSEKEKDNESLTRLINSKQRKIQQLEDIIELKQMNFSSHISSSQHKSIKIKDSQQSQCSLRYSVLSNNFNKDKTMQLELSEAGQSFYENNQSMISNVSEVFGREEFPYQKMQLRRVQQRRLFEKTAAYIKSLKHAIDQKNKRIKLLQKKIESLRNSELIRKDIYQIKQNLDFQANDEDIFKDYYSVQLETSHSHRYKFKQLEHQTKLTIEENNLLNNQIENLQEQLLKSEQQEASLMKLKDLYKDQIKTLIKKNQQQTKVFEDEIKKQRQKVEQSQSVQRMQALKQLFLKIVNLVALIQSEGHKSKKKEERKKELQEYIKVFCNFINLQESARDKLLSEIRK